MQTTFNGLLLLLMLGSCVRSPPLARPLHQGHSHNDYWRPHPLTDALQLGFQSVEADIFLVDSSLLVGHDRASLQPSKTLQTLYLEPLRQLLRTRKKLYAQPAQLWLYVDFKNEGPAAYARLHRILLTYQDILSTPQQPRVGGVQVILSGGYPRELALADAQRLVYLDGALTDLELQTSAAYIPTVNGNWQKCFQWKGQGPIPAEEAAQLRRWNEQAVRNGQKIRFWNLPATNPEYLRAIWRELLRYPALLVGADELDSLQQTIQQRIKS